MFFPFWFVLITSWVRRECKTGRFRVFWIQMNTGFIPDQDPDSVTASETTATEQSCTPSPAPAQPSPPLRSPAPDSTGILLWVRDLVISAVAAALIILFLYQPVRVEGTSMLPRLEDSDRLFINKFVYHVSAIDRGDVVVFHYPRDPEKSYIKRVIALPGDDLRVDQGHVFVNGKLLSEPYVPPEYQDNRSVAEMTLPPHEYYMMGDHRSISSDSRDFGPVERSLIYGKAVFVYWPTRDAGVVH
jgi:signal peptidase I